MGRLVSFAGTPLTFPCVVPAGAEAQVRDEESARVVDCVARFTGPSAVGCGSKGGGVDSDEVHGPARRHIVPVPLSGL